MTVSVNAPFALFVDAAGDPLDDGYVYIGTANLNPRTNPIAVYWDEALTIPAVQPLRTSSGVIVRSGSPANVFVGSDYSIAVHDADNAQIYTVASQSGLPVTGGSITLASGESLTAQNGSDVILDDGSEMQIGDATGVGVIVTVASNARIVGNLVPNVNEAGALGSASRRWASLNTALVQVKTGVFAEVGGTEVVGDDAAPFAEVVGQEIRATNLIGFSADKDPSTATEALAFSQMKNVIAVGRVSSTGTLSTNHYNVSAATNAAGLATVTFDQAVEDDAVVMASVASLSVNHEIRWEIQAGGVGIDFQIFNSGVLTSLNFAFVVFGRPRGGVTNPIA